MTSVLDRQIVEGAFFKDSYRAGLSTPDATVIAIFFAIFGQHPAWIKALLILRNKIAGLCGLDLPTNAEILRPEVKSDYAPADKIGPWPIFSLSDRELVAGRNNKHLDFRLSVLKTVDDGVGSVVVSTICTVHNAYGKIYLFFIVPFHKWGVQHLIAKAIRTGRLQNRSETSLHA